MQQQRQAAAAQTAKTCQLSNRFHVMCAASFASLKAPLCGTKFYSEPVFAFYLAEAYLA
jgi:hypothetical protein